MREIKNVARVKYEGIEEDPPFPVIHREDIFFVSLSHSFSLLTSLRSTGGAVTYVYTLILRHVSPSLSELALSEGGVF